MVNNVANAFTDGYGFTNYGVEVKKMGNLVRISLNGDIQGLTDTENNKRIGTLSAASGCIPSSSCKGIGCVYSTGNDKGYACWVNVGTNGVLAIQHSGDAKYLSVEIIYFI